MQAITLEIADQTRDLMPPYRTRNQDSVVTTAHSIPKKWRLVRDGHRRWWPGSHRRQGPAIQVSHGHSKRAVWDVGERGVGAVILLKHHSVAGLGADTLRMQAST